jgi:hypothetical protein
MEFIERLKLVTNNLEKCSNIKRYSTKDENQADTLANALIDIEESIRSLDCQISKLYVSGLEEVEVVNIVHSIGEELRHILYHVKDSKIFDYLIED